MCSFLVTPWLFLSHVSPALVAVLSTARCRAAATLLPKLLSKFFVGGLVTAIVTTLSDRSSCRSSVEALIAVVASALVLARLSQLLVGSCRSSLVAALVTGPVAILVTRPLVAADVGESFAAVATRSEQPSASWAVRIAWGARNDTSKEQRTPPGA